MPTSCVASASESSTVVTPPIIPTASSQANIITTTTVTAKGFPRKPPPLPPRQMSLPKPAPQLPDIEDEDEESTPPAVTDKEAEAAAGNLRITGQMVASASNLSSWSSTASVATRTNTDNPASMSHYVTNFNITKLARQQQQLGSRSAGQPSSASADHLQGAKKDQKTTEDVPLKVFKQTPV